MLRNFKSYHINERFTRANTVMYDLASELSHKVNVNSIYFDNNKENKQYKQYQLHNNNNKFNNKYILKQKVNDLIKEVKVYEKKEKRVALRNISNMEIDSDDTFKHVKDEGNKQKRIYTRCKITFYDEVFDRDVKIKKFKEDEVSFTQSKILPSIHWQKIDNDVKTDDEQMNDAKDMLMGWLGEAIKHIKKDEGYLKENIDKAFKFKKR